MCLIKGALMKKVVKHLASMMCCSSTDVYLVSGPGNLLLLRMKETLATF
jgi:hypothetical protein